MPKFCLLHCICCNSISRNKFACEVSFWEYRPESCCSHFICLDGAPDKPIIDVSSAHGLNEPCSGAFLSSDTDGEQTREGLSSSSSSSSFSPFRAPFFFCLSPSIHHSSACVFWISTSLLKARHFAWISPSSTCHLFCRSPPEACVTVMMPG